LLLRLWVCQMKTALVALFVFMWFIGPCAIAQNTGSIQGKATDSSGAPILAAVVVVEGADGSRHTTVTDTDGGFKIVSLPSGNYNVKISANGLSDWTASDVPASVEPESNPLLAVLQVAPEITSVTVTLPPEEVAAEQLGQEMKRRTLGVIPNYYVTFEAHPAPLSPRQKLHLGWKLLVDPATFTAAGITAGIQQAKNSYWQWGQGTGAFAKRYWAAYFTAAQNVFITSVAADSVFHQDPRYFYSGQGSTPRRIWYAVESAFRAKGDNGKWQPPYAGVAGLVASAELSQIYYPGSRTQYSLLGRSLMFHFGGLVGLNLAEEFFLKRVTSHTPQREAAADGPVLREGTPVPLIAVDGFSEQGAANGQAVTFVLAEDLTVSGKVLAKTGDVASGQVGQVSTLPGGEKGVLLERTMLRTGNVEVPLRSSQVRGNAEPVQHKELSESGKVEVTLFVAQDVRFPEAQ
jgi:hypothetical protein